MFNSIPAEERPFVFVVEDNSGDEMMTLRSLRGLAKTTEVARDGSEALDRLRSLCEGGRVPDVVLLDLKLPLMNGFEVLQAIQEDGQMPDIPVIVLSSSDLESDHAKAEELGVREFVSKPVSYQSYIETVRRAVNEALLTD